jgi:predicted RNA-binding protein YlqC (UPF0109 family)
MAWQWYDKTNAKRDEEQVMQELDKEFVEYVVRALVNHPEAVVVKRSVDDMGVLLELSVDPEDMGKVIGKAGATAKSLRTLLRVLGSRNDARVNLKIIEPEGGAVNESAEVAAEEQVQPDGDESELSARHRSDIDDLDDDLEL